jgi:hypothetical protein
MRLRIWILYIAIPTPRSNPRAFGHLIIFTEDPLRSAKSAYGPPQG